jgi:Uri superfamily endonuclease
MSVDRSFPLAPGAYALVLRLAEDRDIAVGRLGKLGKYGPVPFPAGWYVYCGSALGGLAGRLRRYVSGPRRRHWHIDYLLEYAALVSVAYTVTDERLECKWSDVLGSQPNGRRFPFGFGASDCRCPGHLIWLPTQPDLTAILPTVVFENTESSLEQDRVET